MLDFYLWLVSELAVLFLCYAAFIGFVCLLWMLKGPDND